MPNRSDYLVPLPPGADSAKILLVVLALLFTVLLGASGCASACSAPCATRPATTPRVALRVANDRVESVRVWVIRQGYAERFVGVVPGLTTKWFDISEYAPVGAAVRFAAQVSGEAPAYTMEIGVLSSGFIDISVTPTTRGYLRLAQR